jgi:hypothetical protein
MPATHRCSKCRESKPATEFYRNPQRKPGVSSKCILCYREHAKAASAARRAKEALRKLSESKKVKSLSKKPKASQKPRKRIPAMSEQKRKWTDLYREKCEADPEVVQGYAIRWEGGDVPTINRIHGPKHCFERHHVGRRHRWLILWYVYVTPELHQWIEANSAKARELGLLFSVESGHMRNPSKYDPLNCLEEFYRLQDKYIFTTVLR